MRRRITLAALIGVLLPFASATGDLELRCPTFGVPESTSASASYIARVRVGGIVIGKATSPSFHLTAGACGPIPMPCLADLANGGDGVVGTDDLLIILSAWGTCTDACPADLDDDGVVALGDLLILLAAWGPC